MDGAKRDLLAEWLELGRMVLEQHFPESPYATLVIPMGEDRPDTVICVTAPRPPSSPTRTPRLS